jgi:hypothetical protein
MHPCPRRRAHLSLRGSPASRILRAACRRCCSRSVQPPGLLSVRWWDIETKGYEKWL